MNVSAPCAPSLRAGHDPITPHTRRSSDEPAGARGRDTSMESGDSPREHSHLTVGPETFTALSNKLAEGQRVLQQLMLRMQEVQQTLDALAGDCPECTSTTRSAARVPQPRPAPARLTHQERRVLEFLARGKTNAEIARKLGLSEKTVKNYVHSVLGKLGVTTRTEAAVVALKSRSHPCP